MQTFTSINESLDDAIKRVETEIKRLGTVRESLIVAKKATDEAEMQFADNAIAMSARLAIPVKPTFAPPPPQQPLTPPMAGKVPSEDEATKRADMAAQNALEKALNK